MTLDTPFLLRESLTNDQVLILVLPLTLLLLLLLVLLALVKIPFLQMSPPIPMNSLLPVLAVSLAPHPLFLLLILLLLTLLYSLILLLPLLSLAERLVPLLFLIPMHQVLNTHLIIPLLINHLSIPLFPLLCLLILPSKLPKLLYL